MYSQKKKYFLISLALVGLLLLYIYVSNPLVVTVTGVGETSVPASFASFSYTLSAKGDNAQTAINGVNQQSNKIKELLRANGVAEKNIVSSIVNVVPASLVTAGATGFDASLTMGAKMENIASLETLIGTLYSNGATYVSQPVLSSENQDKLQQEAFDKALKDANKQSTSIARKNWKFFKKAVSIIQTSTPATSTVSSKAADETTGTSDLTFENGTFKLSTAVSVSYVLW